mmetsp:Transcript_34337/g.91836  ORF Transcript_34337/g.91836 Transcript_34337/m.91836 type:complete len:126 (+) Transcript_34337:1034-1411(+)
MANHVAGPRCRGAVDSARVSVGGRSWRPGVVARSRPAESRDAARAATWGCPESVFAISETERYGDLEFENVAGGVHGAAAAALSDSVALAWEVDSSLVRPGVATHCRLFDILATPDAVLEERKVL